MKAEKYVRDHTGLLSHFLPPFTLSTPHLATPHTFTHCLLPLYFAALFARRRTANSSSFSPRATRKRLAILSPSRAHRTLSASHEFLAYARHRFADTGLACLSLQLAILANTRITLAAAHQTTPLCLGISVATVSITPALSRYKC